jgi:signal transduction histidine kinase/ActR/RegA family two-component response regulator
MDRKALFDERFESLARSTRRTLGMQASLVAVFAGVLGVNIGWATAAAWVASGAIPFLWMTAAMRPPPSGPRSLASGLNCLVAMLAGSALWTSASVLFWVRGNPGLRIISLVLLASQLISAHSLSFKSRLGVAAFGAAPALAIIALPVLFGGFGPTTTVSIAVSLMIMLGYLARDVQLIATHASALERAQDQAVTANKAKSAFLAMMSHELRTPLNGVLGMAHALSMTRLSRRQSAHVEMIVRSGHGLMGILNDILDVSKIEAGRMELEIIDFDLYDLGQRVHDLWSQSASAKSVRLVLDVDPATPQWVRGDPTRLGQVMTNLVSNALKFTREGEVRITVRPDAAAPDTIALAVADTGVGMTPAQQAKLFQTFPQADISTTREYGGTGLGLAICKQLVELMGGRIVVESRPGEGATFTVVVRLVSAAPVLETICAEPALQSLEGRQVLVVDDHAINHAVAGAILEAVGATAVMASDGLEALDRLRSQRFDVILMDIHMPRMGGLEVLAAIRKGAAGRADALVIALTADAMAGVDAGLLAHGFDAVAAKPINPAELVSTISALLAAPLANPRPLEKAQAA